MVAPASRRPPGPSSRTRLRQADHVQFTILEGHPMADVRAEIEEMVDRETRAWNAKDAGALVELFHPDMVWPWPPGPRDHDPAAWVFVLGRYDRERWKKVWEDLFATHTLVHNYRVIRKVELSREEDAALAIVDIDTLW